MNREERRSELRKHGGPSHPQEDHGNWARGGSKGKGVHGRMSRMAGKIRLPGRSLQREIMGTGKNPAQGARPVDAAAADARKGVEVMRYVNRLEGGSRTYARGYLNVLTGNGDIQRVRQRAADDPTGPSQQQQKEIEYQIDSLSRRMNSRRREK